MQLTAHYTSNPQEMEVFAQRRVPAGGGLGMGSSQLLGVEQRGNTWGLLDPTSQVLSDVRTYSAFGDVVQAGSSWSEGTPFGYGGQVGYYQDTPAPLGSTPLSPTPPPTVPVAPPSRLYVRARHYNAPQARWLNVDPIGFNGDDWNFFRYVGNNPSSFIDPSGNFKVLLDPKLGESVRGGCGRAIRYQEIWLDPDEKVGVLVTKTTFYKETRTCDCEPAPGFGVTHVTWHMRAIKRRGLKPDPNPNNIVSNADGTDFILTPTQPNQTFGWVRVTRIYRFYKGGGKLYQQLQKQGLQNPAAEPPLWRRPAKEVKVSFNTKYACCPKIDAPTEIDPT